MGMSVASRERYSSRIKAVENYIHEHLDETIDLNRLADVACMSPFHWHRVYHAIQGETVHATLSRLRLQQAARLLASSELPLKGVARRAGYSAAPPFSRAFKAAYGVTPMQYRKAGPHAQYQGQSDMTAAGVLEVSIQEKPAYQCVAISHSGSYMEIDRSFSALYRCLAANDAMTNDVETIGVYFDDPSIVNATQLESIACAAGYPPGKQPAELDTWLIPAGPHAVLRHRGPYDGLDAAYQWLFGSWLTNSGHEPADEPVYEMYLNDPRTTAPMDLLVDICLPLGSE